MKDNLYKSYIMFWLSQSVSQLGSAMTGYALVVWAYAQTKSAMTVSILTFCSYVPFVIGSIVSGTYIDRFPKKLIMIVAHGIAACCTCVILIRGITREIQITDIYVNVIQYSTIPIGILLGGILADQVFEPFMASGVPPASFLGNMVGTGKGSGMAVMFLCTGICGCLASIFGYCQKDVKDLRRELAKNSPIKKSDGKKG